MPGRAEAALGDRAEGTALINPGLPMAGGVVAGMAVDRIARAGAERVAPISGGGTK
jgi:hypothetical protein